MVVEQALPLLQRNGRRTFCRGQCDMVLVKGAAAEAQRRTFGHDRVALGHSFVAIPAAFIIFSAFAD